VRVDTWLEDGRTIPPYYDSLIAKVIVWDESRSAAIERARRALDELELEGVPTTREAALEILDTEAFRTGDYSTSWLEHAALAAVAS
jgi:acetyl-CoA carboxylase biotin carboxylase subunit